MQVIHSWRSVRLLLVLAACLVAGLAYWRFSDVTPKKNQASESTAVRRVPVAATVVQRVDFSQRITGLGTVTPLNIVTVRARVDGELAQVFFEEGQMVERGALLAQIDPRPFQVQLAQAEGQLARDRALLLNAQNDLKRYRKLITHGAVSQQQVETQEALVNQYEGTVRADQANVDNALLQLTYCRVVAPVSGRVGLRQMDPGNMVRAADPGGILVITQMSPMAVVFAIPEANLPQVYEKLRTGTSLTVEAYDRDLKRRLAEGRLLTMDNQIDVGTGTVKLKAVFDNENHELFPNQFVNARLLVQVYPGTVVVPTPAVQRGPRGAYVFVVNQDSTVSLRLVETAASAEGRTVITKGLSPGERIVTDGTDRLRDKTPVEIREQPGDGPGEQGA